MLRIAALLGILAATARADDITRLEVAVGATIEREVGFAIGLLCDDTTIVQAEVRAGTPESNRFVVTGLKEGTTMCRVGTAPERPSFVFELHVVPPRKR